MKLDKIPRERRGLNKRTETNLTKNQHGKNNINCIWDTV